MEPLGKFAQNGVVAGQGGCAEKILRNGTLENFTVREITLCCSDLRADSSRDE
jgi:hypothetical protein